MIPTVGAQTTSRGLPPLGEGLLSIYRILWFVLAASAIGILILSIIPPTTRPLIVGLRLLKAVIVITVAAILFRRRQRDGVAALLSLALLLWTVTSSFDFTSSMTFVPTVLDRIRFLLFTLALLLFPTGEWLPRWTRIIAVVTAAAFAIGTAEAVDWLPTRIFLPLAIPCVVAAIVTLIIRFRTASSEVERLQLKWVALGLVSGIGCILLARAGLALTSMATIPVASPVLLEAVFQIGIVLLALGFLVSLLRYRLFDVETVVSRSAAYGGLTLALLATFAASEAVIETLGQNYFGMSIGNAAAAIAAAIAAVLLTPLHHRISHWAEQHFQRDLVSLKEHLPELLAELSAGSSSGRLGAVVLPRISEAVHAARAALVVNGSVVAAHRLSMREARAWRVGWDPSDCLSSMDCDGADALFPVRVPMCSPSGRTRAWLLLGPRPDGSLFGKDEIKAIVAVRPALRRALAAIIERDAERARARRLGRAPFAKIRELSARLEELESVVAVHQGAVVRSPALPGPHRASARTQC